MSKDITISDVLTQIRDSILIIFKNINLLYLSVLSLVLFSFIPLLYFLLTHYIVKGHNTKYVLNLISNLNILVILLIAFIILIYIILGTFFFYLLQASIIKSMLDIKYWQEIYPIKSFILNGRKVAVSYFVYEIVFYIITIFMFIIYMLIVVAIAFIPYIASLIFLLALAILLFALLYIISVNMMGIMFVCDQNMDIIDAMRKSFIGVYHNIRMFLKITGIFLLYLLFFVVLISSINSMAISVILYYSHIGVGIFIILIILDFILMTLLYSFINVFILTFWAGIYMKLKTLNIFVLTKTIG
jgi:hypothetical protein